MNVKYYTYKVEFQDRGAGHIHGTLWLRLGEIEKRIKGENLDDSEELPFRGLTAAFKKLRENKTLENEDKTALRNFIDDYTSVSIHENTIGN